MWNRVVLLATGMAFGWNLVNYFTVAPARREAQRLRIIVSAMIGVALIISLGMQEWQAAAVGSVVFLGTALIAYAANARQASRVEDIPRLIEPERGATQDRHVVVLLVAEGEPVEYDGPNYWARRFRSPGVAALALPHWFVRPLTYGRIRAAYAAMGGENPWNGAVARLAERLAERLEPAVYRCEAAFLLAAPTVDRALVRLVKEGYGHVIIVPLALANEQMEALRAQVIHSRARESGLRLNYTVPTPPIAWPADDHAARLARLMAGEAPPAPEEAPEPVIAAALDAVASVPLTFGHAAAPRAKAGE